MSTEALYADYFGFSERPFTLLPDPSFLFWTGQHTRAFSVLEFGVISRAPITLITGEVGAGKTTLVQQLLTRLDDDLTVGLISNAQGGRGELLQWVLNAFSIDMPPGDIDYVRMFQTFQDFLVAEYADGRRVVLIIDEAQNLSMEGLEEIRMLTNVNANKDHLIQLILVGQPELRDMVRKPEMRQLAQRVAASFHLREMDEESVAAYIVHRLRTVGGTGEEFTPEAMRVVYEQTRGVPRLVNQFCDFAMIYAWSSDQKSVTEQTVRQVLDDGLFFGANPVENEEQV